MTPELIAAIQKALDAQFDAGKAVGALECLMLPLIPKPAEDQPPEKEPG